MSTLAMFFQIGWAELLVLAVIGSGVLGVLGLLVFIAVKLGQQSK